MRKWIAGVLALSLVLGGTAFAATSQNDGITESGAKVGTAKTSSVTLNATIEETYTITLPTGSVDNATIGSNGDIGYVQVSNLKLNAGNELQVSAASSDNDEDTNFVLYTSGKASKIAYKVLYGTSAGAGLGSEVKKDEPFATWKVVEEAISPALTTQVHVGYKIEQEAVKEAGTYTDTLTFSVKIDKTAVPGG